MTATGVPAASEFEARMLSPAELISDKWSAISKGQVVIAGVRAPDQADRSLSLYPSCGDGTGAATKLEFGANLGSMYGLFVKTTFLPGLTSDSVSFQIAVDGGGAFLLSNIESNWRAGLLSISGTTASPDPIEELKSGERVTATVLLHDQIILTQSFSLRNSSNAISKLSCR